MPYRGGGKLTLLKPYRPIAAETDGDRCARVTLRHRDSGESIVVFGPLRHRRHRTGRPAAADRHRIRHRLREPGRDRRAQRAGRGPAGQPAGGVDLLCHRPRRWQPRHRQAGQLRLLARYQPRLLGRAADRLQGAASAHARDHRAQLHAQPRRRSAARRCRPAPQPRRRQPVDVPAHRGAPQLRARRLRSPTSAS